MKYAIMLFLCFEIVTFASEQVVSGQAFKFSFGEDPTVHEYPTEDTDEIANFSLTLKNMREDLGLAEPIPLAGVANKSIFNQLIELGKTKNLTAMRPIDIRNVMGDVFRTTPLPNTARQLLSAANYLDIQPPKLKNAIASLYADAIKKEPLISDGKLNEKLILPYDLAVFVGGWLLHDLLLHSAVKYEKSVRLDVLDGVHVIDGPFITNSSTRDGLGCMWYGNRTFQNGVGLMALQLFGVVFEGPVHKIAYDLSKVRSGDKFRCALSNDGRYMLVVGNSWEDSIFDFLKTREEQVKYGAHENELKKVGSVLYNNECSCFLVITEISPENGEGKKHIRVYEINPQNQIASVVYDAETPNKPEELYPWWLRWSCVDDKLIGMSWKRQEKEPDKCVMFIRDPNNIKKFLDYKVLSFDVRKDTWFYWNDNNQAVDEPVSMIYIDAPMKHTARMKHGVAVKKLFIPGFDDILTEVCIFGMHNIEIRDIQFDTERFYLDVVGYNNLQYGYTAHRKGFNPDVIDAIKILDKQVSEGNKNILRESLFLWQWFTQNRQREELSKEFQSLQHSLNPLNPEFVTWFKSMLTPKKRASTMPLPETTWRRFMRNIREFGSSPSAYMRNKMAPLLDRYRYILTGLALGTGGVALWYLLNKSGSKTLSKPPLAPPPPRMSPTPADLRGALKYGLF